MKKIVGKLFLEFMGVGGWLVLIAIYLANRIAFPVAGTNTNLHVLEGLIVAIWLISRWGTWIKDRLPWQRYRNAWK